MFRKIVDVLTREKHKNLLKNIDRKLFDLRSIQITEYLDRHLYQNSKYESPKRLNKFEFQVFSQHGEDGIIKEIFKRIGNSNRFFIEFGVENGTECNSTYLLFSDWKGLWIEGNSEYVKAIEISCSKLIQAGRLAVTNAFINAENIQSIFKRANVPAEPDLLSIDIDRNDYYVWQAITEYRPRVVILEYNAIFRPGDHFVIDYNADATWDGSSNFGASLEAFCQLGEQKGYKLVACDFTGTNAFFVREDLVNNLFEAPYTAENHYEPARYFLNKKDGHPRKIQFG